MIARLDGVIFEHSVEASTLASYSCRGFRAAGLFDLRNDAGIGGKTVAMFDGRESACFRTDRGCQRDADASYEDVTKMLKMF